ncbi:MAG: UbiA family prenyltransferase [Herbaspirillum sp.]|jgi:4-hydroxybenzoate polyprenyltransferase|nr:UbiA family prenyltransferase [Herbaspirillum sp.]
MNARADVPLCVDLDGTLIHTDLLFESFFLLLKRSPWMALQVIGWLFKGRAYCKEQIASRVQINATLLPYNTSLLQQLTIEKESGRTLVLATASHRKFATGVADHLGIFSAVHATEGGVNLSSARKRNRLVSLYGDGGFDYVGNSHADLQVWYAARQAWLVDTSSSVQATLEKIKPAAWQSRTPRRYLKALLKGMRVHQWTKNILIFVPLVAAHQANQIDALLQACAAFFAFGMCASSVYILNDLLDLEADRQHPTKRRRPFAAGTLPISHGMALIVVLLMASIGLSVAALPWNFMLALGAYYVATAVYSFWAKERVTIDVMFLAGLYTMRLVAGAAAITVALSFWLLAFSMFIFLSLALIKRFTEMVAVKNRGQRVASGRGYSIDDMPLIQSMGTSSGYIAVLVLALYLNSPDMATSYSNPKFLWWLCPLLLFWISRVWVKTSRGEMHDDPVVFAAKDKVSRLIGVFFLIATWLAV